MKNAGKNKSLDWTMKEVVLKNQKQNNSRDFERYINEIFKLIINFEAQEKAAYCNLHECAQERI